MFLGSREVFSYILCASCRSLSIENVPFNLVELYAKYPSPKHPQRKKSHLRNLLRHYMLTHSNFFAKKISNSLTSFDDLRLKALYNCKLSKNSRVLDVGTGSGWFVYELHELGFKNVIGIEPALNEDLVLENGAKVYKKTIFELNEKFDFISFHHSFEHLENPIEVLKKVTSLLTDNGTCLLRFPNIESWSFRFFKENWAGIHAPYHLFLPSKKGMEILNEKSGLRIIDIRCEQLLESFLRSTCYSLDFSSHEDFTTNVLIKNSERGAIPVFTKQEIIFWKEKAKRVVDSGLTDYIAYYLKNKN